VVLAVVGGTGALLMFPVRPRLLGRLHESLALGPVGRWIVNLATLLSVVLILTGVVLWWRSKLVRVTRGRGWRRVLHDLHHVSGILGAVVMLVLAATGFGLMATSPAAPPAGAGAARAATPARADGRRAPPPAPARRTRRLIHDLHTGRPYSLPVQVIYFLGSSAFVLQAVSGFTMWWKPRSRSGRGPGASRA
jgi:uncharacterized iron-regulated membrane protein